MNILSRVGTRALAVAVSLVVPIVLVVWWWRWSADATNPYYPSAADIFENFRENWVFERLGSDIMPSLRRMGYGFGLAIIFGVTMGAVLGRVRSLDRLCQPTVTFLRSVPPTALIPVSIAVLGIGDSAKIAMIAFVAMFPILLNTIDGVRGVQPGLEDVAQTFGLSQRQRIFSILLPSAAPQIFAGMRISLAIAFIMMIVSEMLGSTSGMGFVTLNAQTKFQFELMWSGMILLGIVGALLNGLFVLIERRVLRWHYGSVGRAR